VIIDQHKNKVITKFYQNSFLNQKPIFSKLIFPKIDFENDKEYSYELLLKTQRIMKCVCVCVCVCQSQKL